MYISSPSLQWKIKTPFYILSLSAVRSRILGFLTKRPAFKRFSAAILTSRHNWGSLFLPQQEVCFHFIAPRALPFVFLPYSLSTLPASQATHYNAKSTHVLGVGNLGSHYNSVSYQVRGLNLTISVVFKWIQKL